MPEGNKIWVLGDGVELNSKHGPTVADALRELAESLAHLADALNKLADR